MYNILKLPSTGKLSWPQKKEIKLILISKYTFLQAPVLNTENTGSRFINENKVALSQIYT